MTGTSCRKLLDMVRNRNGLWSVSALMTDTTRIVALVGSLRADSLNRRIAEALRDQAPDGVVVEIADGLHELPFYNEDIDTEPGAGGRPGAACARGRGGRRTGRHA